ncbi:MAG: phage portal protein [Dermatophilaceae bacterium]|nr:phage portal protein [Dermatophilaceae bacterium]
MSLFFDRAATMTAGEMIGDRTRGRRTGGGRVELDQARRVSAWWAAQRLRADLISTMPVDVFRRVGGVQIEQKKGPLLITPEGSGSLWCEWMYSTTIDLDSVGNTVGIISAVDGFGLPSVIELQPSGDVTVRCSKSGVVDYKIGAKTYKSSQIWHEKQHTVSGSPVGMSPLAHAALALNPGLSAAQFALDWFQNSTVPAAHLRNSARTLNREEATKVKESFKASLASGDVFVSGNDWEYNMLAAKASESQFIETMKVSGADAARYLGVPGDMIDIPVEGSAITYANITQRNLQLFIINIGPAIARREAAFSTRLLPQPRYAKLNANALLRMDLAGRYEAYGKGIESRFLAPSEARSHEDLPPFTPDQLAEFALLFPAKATAPTTGGTP